MLAEGGRLMGRAGMVAVGLEEMRGGRRVMGLRGRHVVDVTWIECRLIEQRSVEVIALTARGREE